MTALLSASRIAVWLDRVEREAAMFSRELVEDVYLCNSLPLVRSLAFMSLAGT